jgi:hypothetical protein
MLVVFVSAVVAAQAALATAIKLTPAEVAKVDLGKLKGNMVSQLSWSPDGKQLYLQTLTEDKQALPKDYFHYVIPAAGGTFEKVGAAPEWAVTYWTWKSAKNAPDDKAFAIDISQDKRVASATALPMAGELAKGGSNPGSGGASNDAMMAAAMTSSNATIYTMLLKGEIVGEWINHRIMPGVTFGWGPAGTHLVAYADKQSGRLVIMDATGAKQKVDGTKSVVLPAWTEDGSRIAYLEGRGHNQFALIVASVNR